MEKISTLMKKMNVLELIEQIVELTHDQGVTTEIKKGNVQLVSPARPYIKELMARLGIENEMEALFLAVFVDQCNDSRINTKDIAHHFDVRMVKILSMAEYIDRLVRKGIVLRRKDSDGDKRLAQNNDIAPILLFNEADAVLNKRAEGATGSVDKMENAMQNIILQEMEQLEGIMIATTNLTGSLDSAFERRFLYKIEFEKPTPNESRHIWKSMLPELSDAEALTLAKSYAFSGGQIENIARKQLIDNVLSESDSLNIDAIHEACKSESLSKHKIQKIGF